MTDTAKKSIGSNSSTDEPPETSCKDWELYEKEKTLLLHFFTKATSSLQSSLEPVQDELEAREVCKELHSTLDELKDTLKSITERNLKLRKKVRRARKREQLEQELSEFNKLFSSAEKQLGERLGYFEATVARWTGCYRRLHEFCDWLLETEARLTRTENSTLKTTEQQVEGAKAFYNLIQAKSGDLELIEADVKMLTTNSSSQEEELPLTLNLSLVRQKWESLCARSLAQSENLAHWQRYRKLKKQLFLWVAKTERQCAGELAEFDSPKEADNLCALCQALLQEYDENRLVMDDLRRESAHFMDLPNVVDELEAMQTRWNNLGATLRDRLESLENVPRASSFSSNEGDNHPEAADSEASEGDATSSDNAEGSGQSAPEDIGEFQEIDSEVQSSCTDVNTQSVEDTSTKSSSEDVQKTELPMKGVRAIFAEMTSNATRKEQTRAVVSPESRENLVSRLKPVEERAKQMQQCIIESSHGMYPDDMPDRIKTLQDMLAEYNQHKPVTDALQKDLEDFVQACEDEEQKKSMDAHMKILQRLDKIGDMLEARVAVCEKWQQWDKALGDLGAQLQSLQERLNAPNLTAEEVPEITAEVMGLRGRLKAKQRDAESLAERMKATQVFLKDPVTQTPLQLQAKLQELEELCDMIERLAEANSQNLQNSGQTDSGDSGGPVYKICLPRDEFLQEVDFDTTPPEDSKTVSAGPGVRTEHVSTVGTTSMVMEEAAERTANISAQVEEMSPDASPCCPTDMNTAGMAVNIGYAQTLAITMTDARARFDWSKISRDSIEQRAKKKLRLEDIHHDIASLSQKVDRAETSRAESDAALISRVEELVKTRKQEEEHQSKMVERENVVIYYLQPEDKHSDALRQSPNVLQDELLVNLAKELYRRFNIRLLAISQDFVFFMDLPFSEAPTLKRNLPTILCMISNVLHKDFSHTVTWQQPKVCSPWDIWKMAKQKQKVEEQDQDDKETPSREKKLEATIVRLASHLEQEKLQGAQKEAQVQKYQVMLEEDKEHRFTLERLTSLLEKEKQDSLSKDSLIQELHGRLEDIKQLRTDLETEKQNVADKDCLIRELQNRMSRDISRLRQERDEERDRRNREVDSFMGLVRNLSDKSAKLEAQLEDEKSKGQEAGRQLERQQTRYTELEARLQQGPEGLKDLMAENEELNAELQALKHSVKSATKKIEDMKR